MITYDQVVSGHGMWSVEHGSMLDLLKTLPGNSIDSCITDPPYELGFMGRKWDSSGIAFSADTWREVYRVLKPGAHLLAFGGTRTVHRIACAIEDAGFSIREQIEWAYGSGFPKSLNISKGIDRIAGAKRRVIGTAENFGASTKEDGKIGFGDYAGTWDITVPETDEAKKWDGWGTSTKPAHEPIIVARKPFDTTVAENVLRYGTGGLNIDACRIAHASPEDFAAHEAQVNAIKARGGSMEDSWKNSSDLSGASDVSAKGRWPANLLLQHSASCIRTGTVSVKASPTWDTPNRETESGFTGKAVSKVRHADTPKDFHMQQGAPIAEESIPQWECSSDCPVLLMDIQSGQLTSGKMPAGTVRGTRTGYSGHMPHETAHDTIGDTGTASRFFAQFELEDLDLDPFYYCAKPSRAERDLGMSGFAQTSGGDATGRKDGSAGVNNPRAGAGRTGGSRNIHPTIKGLQLMRYLCKLVTPKNGIVLDPFTGSGGTGMAALLENFRFVGIELNNSTAEPFVDIARARIEYVASGEYTRNAVKKKLPAEIVRPGQRSLF